jgi:hypothetical protein
MFDFSDEVSQHEKCYTTIGQLPPFVDPEQPPSKKSPFSAISTHPFIHTVRSPFLVAPGTLASCDCEICSNLFEDGIDLAESHL